MCNAYHAKQFFVILKFILIMMAHSSLQGFNNVHVKNNSLCRVGKAISKSKSGFLLSRFFFIRFIDSIAL